MNENIEKDLQAIVDISREWLENRKIGSLTFNFFKGGVANYIKKESIKFDPDRKKTDTESERR